MWSAPAKVTFPDGNTVDGVIFGEYETEDEMVTLAVFLRSQDKNLYLERGGFGTTQPDLVLLETDIQDFVDLSSSPEEQFMIQKIYTGAGPVIVDWRR